LEVISQAEVVAIDTETYWTKSWENKRIIGVSVYGEINNKHFNGYYPYRHESPDGENLPLDTLESLAKTLDQIPCHVYHNAKFDRSRFLREGLALDKPFYDTMLISHMVDENTSHELEDLAEMYHIDPHANLRKSHIHAVRSKVVWHKIPLSIMEPYACGDTSNTYKLWKRLMPVLAKQELTDLYPIEGQYSDALMHIELRGVRIDQEYAEHLSDYATARMYSISQKLGFDPGKVLLLAKKLFLELKLPILEVGKPSKQFPDGRPKMDEPTMEKLAKKASGEAKEVMDLVLEYRGLQKARSTWYDGFIDKCDSNSRIHTTYNQHVTVTTRLSSVDPNMQQLPRDVESSPVKKMLRATAGYELWEFDYNQIEYRLAGVLSDDPVILDAYRSGSDMHSSTALRLKTDRQSAKTINFLLIYEGGPGRLAETFGISIENARPIWEGYHHTYYHMFAFAARVNATAAQRGYIRLWDGRRRRFRLHFETKKAWNSYVQGGAASIVKRSIVSLHQDKELKSKMVGQVHDSIWFEIPVGKFDEEAERIKYHMEWPTREPKFKIPFPTEAKQLA
jgi:DNA polymerase-1